MPQVDQPERARRVARAIASDIFAYNPDKVQQGLVNDNLFELLAEEIEEGRIHYEMRVTDSIKQNSNHFWVAVVDIIVKQAEYIDSPIH